MSRSPKPVAGAIAGLAGGLAASWLMNLFTAGPGASLRHALQTDAENQAEAAAPPRQDATMRAADDAVEFATGGRHLTWEQQQHAGPVVHYAFGAAMGALYGALSELSPAVSAGYGTVYATALFVGADVAAVPALNLSGFSADPKSLAAPYAAHLVYGISTDLIRRGLRSLF